MNKIPITVEGAEKLRTELQALKMVDRPKVIQAIATAREHGDLKENAEYHAAREQQGFIEGRIRELDSVLSNIEVIDVTKIKANGKCVFGATVDLLDIESGDEICYKIVGNDEADIKQGLISISSPIARALIGKQVDDVATVQAPAGTKEYEIVQIRYI